MAHTPRLPSALCATAALVASLGLGMASAVHAQSQQPIQPQPQTTSPGQSPPTQHAQKSSEADMLTLSGAAAYRERIAMPPNAVLTVQLQDISRADAPAQVVAQTQQTFGQLQVPLTYRLQVPRAAIDPRMRYALRAMVHVDGELRFATTKLYPVLTQGATSSPPPLNLAMETMPIVGHQQPGAVNTANAAALPSVGAPINTQTTRPQASAQAVQLDLPATFAGVLPCANCAGMAHTLTLQPDGSYRLRYSYLGKTDVPVVRAGQWTADQGGQRLALRRSDESARAYFKVQPDGSLHALDTEGNPYASKANLDLRRTAQLDPTLEAASPPPSALHRAMLQDTPWKLVALHGHPTSPLPEQEREVRITLNSEKRQVQGFTGCNALLGGHYTLSGADLQFDQLASTRKMCAPASNALEQEVLDALRATTRYRIDGEQLMLLGSGRVLARFEATSLR